MARKPKPNPSQDPAVNPHAAGPPAPGTTPAKPATSKIPPPPPPPPAPTKTPKGSQWQQFVNYWGSKYPAFKRNAQAIYLAAKAQNIDPITFGALVLNESGGNFQVGDSRTGAIGIGQLEPGSFIGPNAFNHGVFPWDPNHKITLEDLRNPGTNLRLSAAYYGYLQGKYPADTYGRYNAGPNASDAQAGAIQTAFWKKWVGTWNAKYVPQSGSTAPPGKAGTQVPGGETPQTPDIKDPWVVFKNGKITTVGGPNPPKNAVTYGSTPMRLSDYNRAWTQTYADTFFAYTGRKARPQEIIQILKAPPTPYTLAQNLAKKPGFVHSPTFKKSAPGFIADAQSILGQNWKPPKGFIANAISQNWDQATFEAKVRQLPAYEKSPEFQDNVAKKNQVFQSIYGNHPDGATKALIKDVAKAGWTPDQFADWLRAQDAYKQSPEYQSKWQAFASQMGLITGAVPTLSEDQVNKLIADPILRDPAAPATGGGPGGAASRPDNRPGPRGAGGAAPSAPPQSAYPTRPDNRSGVRGP